MLGKMEKETESASSFLLEDWVGGISPSLVGEK